MTAAVLSSAALHAAIQRLPDNGLAAARRAALDALQTSGMPTPSDEDWKYTDLKHVVEIGNRWLADAPAEDHGIASPGVEEIIEAVAANWVIIDNGRVDVSRLDAAGADGITATRLSERGIDVLESSRLGNLNTALLVDGLHIAVTGEPERPIGLLFVDHAQNHASMVQARVELALAPDANASFIEHHISHGGAEHYANTVLHLTLAAGASADYVRLQERSRNHDQTARLVVNVGRDAGLQHSAFDLGGRLIRNDLELRLDAVGAHSSISGLYLVGDGQHIDNHTRVDHLVGPAVSRQAYRGILTGRARGVWNGKTIVHPGADGTDAEQSNDNLLLSRNAEINAKPELEIYADDVKCSHGTTVGQLDQAALFYLRTRGLDRHDARQILTRAFAQAIVANAPIAQVRDLLAARIAVRLEELMHGADE